MSGPGTAVTGVATLAPPPPGPAPGGPGAVDPDLVPVLTPAARPRRSVFSRPWARLLSPVLLVVAWQLVCSLSLVDPKLLQPPSTVVTTFVDLLSSGELAGHLWTSLRRVLVGLSAGVVVGLVLAAASSLTVAGDVTIDPLIHILRSLPIIALTPLFMIWLGIGESPKVAIVLLATSLPVYIHTRLGIRGLDAGLLEAGQVFGLSRWGVIRHVVLPGAVASVLMGLRVAVGLAWLALVVGEQINAQGGIGALMVDAQQFFRNDIILMGLVIYGLMGLASDALVRALERRALAWRRQVVLR